MRAVLAVLLALTAFAQPVPRFESAEISASNGPGDTKGRFNPNGRIDVPYTTLKELIAVAYGVQESMIDGAPAWCASDHFQLTAQAPPNTPMNAVRLMLRPLMAERFKLAVHTGERMMPVYGLVVARRSPRLHPSPRQGPQSCQWTSAAGGQPVRECRNLSMADLALQLPAWDAAAIDRPVVDATELRGTFDFSLLWKPNGPAAREALDQIGLKLEPRQHRMQVIVVDRAERPAIAK
jgi:uncharacterized protein (TIGR03435 family)